MPRRILVVVLAVLVLVLVVAVGVSPGHQMGAWRHYILIEQLALLTDLLCLCFGNRDSYVDYDICMEAYCQFNQQYRALFNY